jgi:hypothetical protein
MSRSGKRNERRALPKENLLVETTRRSSIRQASNSLQAFDQERDDQEYEAGKGQPECFDGQKRECAGEGKQGKETEYDGDPEGDVLWRSACCSFSLAGLGGVLVHYGTHME